MNRLSTGDRVFYSFVYLMLILILVVVGYPLIYILSASFSSPIAVSSGQVILWPVNPSIDGYEAVFKTKEVWLGYRNSIFYTVVGTAINVIITLVAAYPLSRRDMAGRGFLMFLFTFTMLFSGGLIPTYILLGKLGMINTVWALLIPGALGVHNMIITRTFFQSNIPSELLESAQIDGCSDFRFFLRMVLPLSKAVIAVITLYYAIGHWNEYFNAFIYLTDNRLYPLQIFLRNILLQNIIDPNVLLDEDAMAAKSGLADLLKFSLIVVASVPIMMIYPFVQKYFVKGVMIGSLKG